MEHLAAGREVLELQLVDVAGTQAVELERGPLGVGCEGDGGDDLGAAVEIGAAVGGSRFATVGLDGVVGNVLAQSAIDGLGKVDGEAGAGRANFGDAAGELFGLDLNLHDLADVV